MGKTGFRIGCLNRRIVITHTYTKAVYMADPDVRDWITIIETISASGSAIPGMIILSGSVLLQKHFNNNLDDKTLFGITSSGYSNNLMGMEYIQHFNKMTEKHTKRNFRMLVFDGHGSHISDEFTWFCWNKNIIPFRLPAHTTHLLQPFDVGIFQPLKHWHQEALYQSIQYGDLDYTKIDFLNAYQDMRNRTFTTETIMSAWRKTGLYPFNPNIVIEKLKVYEPDKIQPPEVPMTPKTAYCTHSSLAIPPFYPTDVPRPFQSIPTTGNREAHRVYLSLRLQDHMDGLCALTPSYACALQKYQQAVEPCLLEAIVIKGREMQQKLQEIEKVRIKSGSRKHVQKNGVIYKGYALKQIEEHNWEDLEVLNVKLERKCVKVSKLYKKWVKDFPKLYSKWGLEVQRAKFRAVLVELASVLN
jgi:hypothetical protein